MPAGAIKREKQKIANHFKVSHNPFPFEFNFRQHCSEIDNAELFTENIISQCYAEEPFHAGYII